LKNYKYVKDAIGGVYIAMKGTVASFYANGRVKSFYPKSSIFVKAGTGVYLM